MSDPTDPTDPSGLRLAMGRAVLGLRETTPLVQCLTNYVSMDLAANVLNAAGASPAMVHDEREADEMAGLAAAVVVNIGTLSPPWIAGMRAAATVAGRRGVSWVLDPVAVGATAYRRETARELLALGPSVIRGNASEVVALATATSAGRGVDAMDDSLAVVEHARTLARSSRAVVVVSGATDVVTDGERTVLLTGGHRWMPMVSALGCASSALVGACCAAADDPLVGAATAMAMLAAAGWAAAERSAGPGTLRVHLLDELASLETADLDRVEVQTR